MYTCSITGSHSKSYLVTTEFMTCVYEFRTEVFQVLVPVFPTVSVFGPEAAELV